MRRRMGAASAWGRRKKLDHDAPVEVTTVTGAVLVGVLRRPPDGAAGVVALRRASDQRLFILNEDHIVSVSEADAAG